MPLGREGARSGQRIVTNFVGGLLKSFRKEIKKPCESTELLLPKVPPQLWVLGERIRQESLQKSYQADDIIFC